MDWISVGAIREDGTEEPIYMEKKELSVRGKVMAVATTVGTMAVFMVCVAYLVDSTFSPFLYFIF